MSNQRFSYLRRLSALALAACAIAPAVSTAQEVTVVSIQGDKVRLGFEFGREVGIDRHELYERKQAEPARGATPDHAA